MTLRWGIAGTGPVSRKFALDLRMLPGAAVVGLYGFGAAAHLVAQVALAEGRRVFAFTRRGDAPAQDLARALGVHWAGDSTQAPPARLDSTAASMNLTPRAPSTTVG